MARRISNERSTFWIMNTFFPSIHLLTHCIYFWSINDQSTWTGKVSLSHTKQRPQENRDFSRWVHECLFWSLIEQNEKFHYRCASFFKPDTIPRSKVDIHVAKNSKMKILTVKIFPKFSGVPIQNRRSHIF